MGDLQVWQLAADGLLVLSLFYLCLKVAGQSSSPLRTGSLETGLRRLIQEAEAAGRALNERLIQRQRTLDELLADLENAESRAAQTLRSIEDARAALEEEQIKRQRALRELKNQSAEPAAPLQSPRFQEPASPEVAAESAPAARPLDAADERAAAVQSEPKSVRGYGAYQAAKKQAAAPAVDAPEEEAPRRWQQVNIYGEPIAAPEAAPPPRPKKSLAQSVEKELHNPYSSGSQGEDELQRVYDMAENLLRSGKSLESVAGATSLPLDEVRMLSQMMVQDRSQKQPEADNRLGALGPVRRHIQTL